MKKFLSILMAIAMVLSVCLLFAGCTTDTTGEDETSAQEDTSSAEAAATGSMTATDGVLVMATNAAFPPYEYVEGDGYAGIDIEIAEKIAEKLGMTLEIKDVEFGSIVGGVQTGKYDIGMAGMTVTDERLESVNFSTSYATAIQSVIVLEDSEYASFEDFYTGFDDEGNPAGVKDGIKIGVQQDTTGDIYSSDDAENWGFGSDNVIRYKTGADAVQALLTGKVTAVIIDNEPAKSYVSSNDGLKILDGEYAVEDYAICVAKENTALLDAVNTALSELEAEGVLGDIVAKYISAE